MHTLFGATFLHRAEHYESFFYWLALGQTVVTVVVFALYAWRGAGFARESAAGPIGTAMLLAMLGVGLVWLVTVPFDVLSLWWQRRYDQATESYAEALFGDWVLLAVKFALLSFAVVVAVGLAKWLPRLWWIPASAVFIGLQVLLLFTTPYLVPDTHRLRNPRLEAAAARIAEQEGVKGVPIREETVHTKDPNAFTTGLGPSRRVFVWSSMLDGRFTERQLEVVVAHEYGHQARNHLLKGIALVRALDGAAGVPDRAGRPESGRDAGGRRHSARAARLRRRRAAGDAGQGGGLAAHGGGGRLDGVADDAHASGDRGALAPDRYHRPERPEPADRAVPGVLGSPDARPARGDGPRLAETAGAR